MKMVKSEKTVREMYFAPQSESVAFLEKRRILIGSTEGGDENESYTMRPLGDDFDLQNIIF